MPGVECLVYIMSLSASSFLFVKHTVTVDALRLSTLQKAFKTPCETQAFTKSTLLRSLLP